MAPQKMLYVKSEDLEILEKATSVSGESLSNTVIKALSSYIEVNRHETFEIQKLQVGAGLDIDIGYSCFERDFRAAFDEAYPEPDYDTEEYERLYDEAIEDVLAYAASPLKMELITFYGREIYSYEHKNTRADLLFGEQMENEMTNERLMTYAPVKDAPLLFFDKEFFADAFKSEPPPRSAGQDGDWLIPESVTCRLFKTAKGQYLLYISPEIIHMNTVRQDGNMALAYISDYVLLKELKPGLKKVKGRCTGATFVLPPRFMARAISIVQNMPTHKVLDI